MMKKLSAYFHDILTALAAGFCAAAAVFAVSFVLGFLFRGFSVFSAMMFVRGALFVVGAIMLFLTAGFMLWPKGDAKLRASEKWKRFFQTFSMAGLLLWAAAVVLFIGCIVDRLLLY